MAATGRPFLRRCPPPRRRTRSCGGPDRPVLLTARKRDPHQRARQTCGRAVCPSSCPFAVAIIQRALMRQGAAFAPSRICAQEETMKLVSLMIVGAALTCSWTVTASAQQAVRPQWNYQGSAVCPDGYDYRGGLCRARGYGGGYARYGGGYGGGGIPPRWNRAGSAVCPEGYDYHAHSGYCRPQY